MTKQLTSDDLVLNLAHLGVSQWCMLLGHTCDGVDGQCTCPCHYVRRD